jgi:hypothetical protein
LVIKKTGKPTLKSGKPKIEDFKEIILTSIWQKPFCILKSERFMLFVIKKWCGFGRTNTYEILLFSTLII